MIFLLSRRFRRHSRRCLWQRHAKQLTVARSHSTLCCSCHQECSFVTVWVCLWCPWIRECVCLCLKCVGSVECNCLFTFTSKIEWHRKRCVSERIVWAAGDHCHKQTLVVFLTFALRFSPYLYLKKSTVCKYKKLIPGGCCCFCCCCCYCLVYWILCLLYLCVSVCVLLRLLWRWKLKTFLFTVLFLLLLLVMAALLLCVFVFVCLLW